MSSTAFSAGVVAVGHFAPFADTVDGAAGDIASHGSEAMTYNARQLTRPVLCVDDEEMPMR